MLWPFISKDKDAKELEKDLPTDLQLFFEKVNPESHLAASGDSSAKDNIVDKVLAREVKEYSHEFAKYKRDELLKKVAAINCAEIQEAVVKCYQGWLFTSSNHCTDEIRKTTKCMDLQNKALRQLRYEDCYNKPQCQQMRVVVDYLFTRNFGKLGENVNEETEKNFEREVEGVFAKLWK